MAEADTAKVAKTAAPVAPTTRPSRCGRRNGCRTGARRAWRAILSYVYV